MAIGLKTVPLLQCSVKCNINSDVPSALLGQRKSRLRGFFTATIFGLKLFCNKEIGLIPSVHVAGVIYLPCPHVQLM